MEFMHDGETNCFDNLERGPLEDNKAAICLPNSKLAMDCIQYDVRKPDGKALTLERGYDGTSCFGFDVNDHKLSGGLLDHEDDKLDEQSHYKEACLDFQSSDIVVETIDSQSLCESRAEESSGSASKWTEQDECLALWFKWRGKWHAGIKCVRADWPLATLKARPSHDRKNYILMFFPHTRSYCWVDTLLVCSINEFPRPIAHRSHKVGIQLVEDLTVARRFIMKKLVIGMLNAVDQLPIQVLDETACNVVVWREFGTEASHCKCYPDLGRLLLKLRNMMLKQYINANWLQHSFQLWVENCQNVVSAESIELLKEELVDSILWKEVNTLRHSQEQPALGSEWKMWKCEVLKCFSATPHLSGRGDIEHPSKNGMEQHSNSPLLASLQISRKRPKLEIRRAEPHHSHVESKRTPDKVVEIDPTCFSGRSITAAEYAVLGPLKEELPGQGTTPIASPRNGVVETKSLVCKSKNRQCIAFIEAKGRRCIRWANDGDDYCCVHLASRFFGNSVKTEVSPPTEAPMCQGTTNLGTRCKHRSLPGLSFCKKHRPRSNGIKPLNSPGSQLKRKHAEMLDNPEHASCKDIVLVGEAESPRHELPLRVAEENTLHEGNSLCKTPEYFSEESNSKNIEIPLCIGLGLPEGGGHCLGSPTRHTLYCDKHIPSWLKRARNGKSRIISKEVFLDLLRACSSWKQKVHLHQACELFYKLLKSVLSLRIQVPKDVQFQWALSEASKDVHVAELLMKLVSREKERLRRIWGFNLNKDTQLSCSPMKVQALMPIKEESDHSGTLKCKICSEEFTDDQTLGAHWIDNHNKEAQWLFRGYACAICLDSFTNRKVLETHVQERHHAEFVEHCMLIQCIPCSSHFGNSEELWSHVLSVHTEGFRQSKTGDLCNLSVTQPNPSNSASIDNNPESQINTRKFICRFCGLKFDLLPDLGRHHQAAHMGPSLLRSRPKWKGLRYYAYRLKSGRLSRPRFKKGLGGVSYRLRNKGSLVLKNRIQSARPLGGGGINVQSHVTGAASLVRLTEVQCSDVAKMLCFEAQKTRARPNNDEILSIARSTCCKVSLQRSLEQKYGVMPERLYLKAAKLCSEYNIQVDWHQEGFNCSKGCKPPEEQTLAPVLTSPFNECTRVNKPPSDTLDEGWEMDESHYVIDLCHYRQKSSQMTIILCDDISFGRESVPVPCVVDKSLIHSLRIPTYGFDGQVIFMPWESFTYVIKPLLDPTLNANMQSLQLGCGCAQSTCSPGICDHVYLFNCDYENAKGIDGKLMEGRFPYDGNGRIILEDGCLVYECNHLCKCSTNCPNRVLQNGVKMKLEVFKTQKKGWAVRASETILRGSFVCEFVGEVLDQQEANRRSKRYGKEVCSYFYDFGVHMKHMSDLMEEQVKCVIDATKYGNVSRFINHSCSPNLVSHLVLVESMDFRLAHVGLYAKQDIGAGEELTYDYRYDYKQQPGAGGGRPCLCGALSCRGRLY